MARIVYSALVDSIRGSIGGTTFQQNKYGYTVKKKPNMIFPRSPYQQRQKIIMKQVLQHWGTMIQTYRDQWESYANTYPQWAKHNPDSQLSGYAAYILYNFYRVLGEFSIADSPTFAALVLPTNVFTVEIDGSVLNLNLDTDNVSSYVHCCLFVSPPIPVGQNFIGTRYRYFLTFPCIDGTIDIATQYLLLFGRLPAEGERIAIRYVIWAETSGNVLPAITEIPEVEAP